MNDNKNLKLIRTNEVETEKGFYFSTGAFQRGKDNIMSNEKTKQRQRKPNNQLL